MTDTLALTGIAHGCGNYPLWTLGVVPLMVAVWLGAVAMVRLRERARVRAYDRRRANLIANNARNLGGRGLHDKF